MASAGVALVAAAIPVGAGAIHRPGHGAAVALSIAAEPSTVTFGQATVISGRLSGPNNAGRRVTLLVDRYPFSARAAAAARTSASGSYRFTQSPDRNTEYQVVAGALRSARVRVNVRFRVGIAVSDASPRSGQLVRFRGRACPDGDGARVGLQRRSADGRFRTIRRTTLKAAALCSTYSRRLRIRRDGTYRVRTDDAAHARGYSRARRIDVH